MNIVCIIARTNSTRLPKKVLKPIGNYSAIEFLIERIKLSKNVDKIYLCTSVDEEDKVLLEIAEKQGINSFAGDRVSVISRMLEVGKKENADNLIRITGDNFLTDYIYLDLMLEKHKDFDADYTRTEFLPIGITTEVMKTEMLIDCYNNMDQNFSEYLLIYAFDPIRYKCNVLIPPKTHQFPSIFLSVDTPNDYNRVIDIYNKFGRVNFSFNDISGLITNELNNKNDNLLVKFPANVTLFYSTYRNEMNERIKISNNIKISLEEYLQHERD